MVEQKKETGEKKDALGAFAIDFMVGGIGGALAKTLTAPLERVKLVIQTQDANPRIISGEIPRYTGMVNCFSRLYQEQGLRSFWRGNFTNITRYVPTQAFNFAFKDQIKKLFPRYDSKTDFGKFFLVQMASGGLAGAGSLTLVYPLDYARTRLAADVGEGGKRDFKGLFDCLYKTARGPRGFLGLYNGYPLQPSFIFSGNDDYRSSSLSSHQRFFRSRGVMRRSKPTGIPANTATNRNNDDQCNVQYYISII